MEETYGFYPEHPIQLNSISASLLFLDNLLTIKGGNLIYHRIGSRALESPSPIDHYEIMTSENQYFDIYINVYNDTNEWIPPIDFLFDGDILFPNRLVYNEIEEFSDKEIEIIEEYIFKPNFLIQGLDLEGGSLLESFLDINFGSNGRIRNFPYPLLEKVLNREELKTEIKQKIINSVKPRKL